MARFVFFIRRILDQLGLPPIKTWQAKFLPPRVSRGGRLQLTPEFHADVEFWRLLLERALDVPLFAIHAPLYSFCSRMLWPDASGDAMGGYCSASEAWGRVDFDEYLRDPMRRESGSWR